MARIAKYEQLAPGNDKVHGQVLCGWKMLDQAGMRYVQLDTYGSPDRQQVDHQTGPAHELLRLLSDF